MPRRRVVTQQTAPNVNVTVSQAKPEEPPAIETPEEKPPTEFWDFMQQIPKQQWGQTYDIMGWRIDPKVPGIPGSKGFLFQVMEPVTPMWMKHNYGGGKFRLTLQKNSKWFKTHEFEIEGNPRYDLTRENPSAIHGTNGTGSNGDRSTELLQQFVGVLRDELKSAREANNGNPSGNDRVIEMLTNASDKAIDIVTRQTPQAQDQTTQLANLVSIVKGLMPPPADSGLTTLLAPLLKPLIEKLMQPTDPMAQVTMFLTIFEKLDTLRGSGTGGDGKAKDWRAMLAEGAVQKGPELLRELRETFQVNKEAAEARRAAAEANARTMEIARSMPAPGQPAANGVPAAATAQAPSVMPAAGPLRVVPINGDTLAGQPSPMPAAVPAPQSAPIAPPAAPGLSAKDTDAVAAFMKEKIVQMVSDGRDAEDIVDFIDDVDPSVNDLLAQFTPEIVTNFLAADSILSKATGLPHWGVFLQNAQAYIKEIRLEDAAIEAHATAVPS